MFNKILKFFIRKTKSNKFLDTTLWKKGFQTRNHRKVYITGVDFSKTKPIEGYVNLDSKGVECHWFIDGSYYEDGISIFDLVEVSTQELK